MLCTVIARPLSIEMATKVGCTCFSMDLIIIKTFYLLKGSEFHPKREVLGNREACPATLHLLRTFCVVPRGELTGTLAVRAAGAGAQAGHRGGSGVTETEVPCGSD